jgi:glyoxylase-like metal-dependent hydrolase (beta-lactamase superfamily II)
MNLSTQNNSERRLPALRGRRPWLRIAISIAAVGVAMESSAQETQSQEIRPGVYVITTQGINTTLQVGPDGAVVVDPGPKPVALQVLASIQKITQQPIRYLVNTSADTDLVGGDEELSKAGKFFINNQLGGAAPVIATQNTLLAMIGGPTQLSRWALPSEVFTRPQYNFYLNSEPIQVISLAGAHSSGDAVVRFDAADVLVTGAIFDDTRFPVIDIKHGGTIQGEIDALNRLLNTLAFADVPLVGQSSLLHAASGTLVVPVRGPVCDQHDLVTYRDMLEMVKVRVESMKSRGATLREVEDAGVVEDFSPRWGTDAGGWTTKDFVDAVYLSESSHPRNGGRGATEPKSNTDAES